MVYFYLDLYEGTGRSRIEGRLARQVLETRWSKGTKGALMRKNAVLIPVLAVIAVAAGFVFYQHRDEVPGVLEYVGLRHKQVAAPTRQDADADADGDAMPAGQAMHNLLAREIVRQALLRAERDVCELVGDRVLDAPGTTAAMGEWDCQTRPQIFKGVFVRVVKAPATKPAVSLLIPIKGSHLDYMAVLERAESLGRVDFPRALGLRAPANRTTQAAAASAAELAEIEARLGEWNMVSQFAAVRAAHAALAASPDDASVTGQLIRGYANLGQLTSTHWSADAKAFAARAMIYAQRLVATQPNARWSRWHRAYALALAGFQDAASADLEAAAKLPPESRPQPYFVDLLAPYCRYDTAALAAAADGGEPVAHLAAFLAFLSVDNSESPALVNAFGQVLLAKDAGCLRAVDRMIESSGVSSHHALTAYGTPALSAILVERLSKVPGVPPASIALSGKLRGNAMSMVAQARLADNLAAAGPSAGGEPSLVALAQMIRETVFVNAVQRTRFMSEELGVPADEVVREAALAVGTHRYFGFLKTAEYPNPSNGAVRAILGNVRLIDPVVRVNPMASRMSDAGLEGPEGSGGTPFRWLMQHTDCNAGDLERMCRFKWTGDSPYERFISELQFVSPSSPVYMAKLIEIDWAEAQQKLPEWENRWGDHPTLSGALGKKYAALFDYPKAERYLKLYLEKAPDAWAYRALADVYIDQDKESDWLKTLKQSLEQPDYQLDHAQTNVLIARHYMSKHDYATAEPFAHAGAESYAAWAMDCAIQCEEGLKHWGAAEQWVQRRADRYGDGTEWYDWCMRTGHGDRAAAERVVLELSIRPVAGLGGRDALAANAAYLLFEGRTAEAKRLFGQALDKYSDSWSGMHLALCDDASKDTSGRDATLDRVIAAPKDHPDAKDIRPAIVALAQLYRDSADAAPDQSAVDALIQRTPTATERLNLAYFAARICQNRGDADAATKYFKLAAGDPKSARNCALAWVALRAMGIDPAAPDQPKAKGK